MDVQVNCSKARERGAVAGNHELGEITIMINKIMIMIMMNMIVTIKMTLAVMMTIFT